MIVSLFMGMLLTQQIPLDWVSTGVSAPGSGTIRLLVTISQQGVTLSAYKPASADVIQPSQFAFVRAERLRAAAVGFVWCVDRSARRVVVNAYGALDADSSNVLYLPVGSPSIGVFVDPECATAVSTVRDFSRLDVLVGAVPP